MKTYLKPILNLSFLSNFNCHFAFNSQIAKLFTLDSDSTLQNLFVKQSAPNRALHSKLSQNMWSRAAYFVANHLVAILIDSEWSYSVLQIVGFFNR